MKKLVEVKNLKKKYGLNEAVKNISFNIHVYENNNSLNKYLEKNIEPGTIYFGPISADDSLGLNTYCDNGNLFFSFSSNKSLADNCVFLLNFFPYNENETIFDYLPENSKVAIVYPENSYGYKINEIVDSVSERSKSIIINRASYKENLENVRSCLLYTSPSPRDGLLSRMPSSA